MEHDRPRAAVADLDVERPLATRLDRQLAQRRLDLGLAEAVPLGQREVIDPGERGVVLAADAALQLARRERELALAVHGEPPRHPTIIITAPSAAPRRRDSPPSRRRRPPSA